MLDAEPAIVTPLPPGAYPGMQKARPARAALSATRKEERKNEKEGKNLYYINARSDIRAAVGHSLDLYGFIITFNC